MLLYLFPQPTGMILLEEDDATLEEVGVADLAQVLIEVRNKDLTWPEEMSQITSTRVMHTQSTQGIVAFILLFTFTQ